MECKNTATKEALHNEWKILKNELQTEIRQNKKAYYNKYFTENKDNLQKIWKGIKEVINIKSKNYNHPTCIIDENKSTVTDPLKIANSFNNYYTSIASNILKKRKYNGIKNHTQFLKNPLMESIALYGCDAAEIELLIGALNPRKAYGPNSIPSDILQLLKKDKPTSC